MYIVNQLVNTEIEATLGNSKRPLAIHLLYTKKADCYGNPITMIYSSNGMVALARVGRYGKKLWPIRLEVRITLNKYGSGYNVKLVPGTAYLMGHSRGSDATRLVAWNDPEYQKYWSNHSTYGMHHKEAI